MKHGYRTINNNVAGTMIVREIMTNDANKFLMNWK